VTKTYLFQSEYERINKKYSYNLCNIVLPVYNSEEFLTETIESVLNQTYNDLELLMRLLHFQSPWFVLMNPTEKK
jgi:hypothetical protein